MQGVKQSVCLPSSLSARKSPDLVGICVCYKHNQLIDIGKKTDIDTLQIAQKGLLVLQMAACL